MVGVHLNDQKYAAMNVRERQALMMEAARTSETLVEIQLRTRQYIPEDSELQINTVFDYQLSLRFSCTGRIK
jgi:hypothetical protein